MLKTMAIMPFAVLRIYIGFAVRNVFRNKFTKSGLICSHLFLKLLYPAFFSAVRDQSHSHPTKSYCKATILLYGKLILSV